MEPTSASILDKTDSLDAIKEVPESAANVQLADSTNECTAGGSGSGVVNWERVNAAKSKLEEAKKLLITDPIDYAIVVDMLDDVCNTLKIELGDLSIETTEALYYYGSALLEQYQNTENLVGSKAKKVIEKVAEELVVEAASDLAAKKDDEIEKAESGDDTTDIGQEVPETEADPDAENGEEEDDENDDETGGDDDAETAEASATNGNSNGCAGVKNVNDSATSTQETAIANGSGSSENGVSNSDGDAIPELRYAWEILETARVGYEKKVQEGATREEKMRLSEIHYKLAICAAENGDKSLAIVEAERSLKTAKEACEPTDRFLAEAFFNVGSIMSIYGQLAEAADNMKSAVSILENLKANLSTQIEALKDSANGDLPRLEKEFKDIEELIPDLMLRLQDTYEDMKLGSEEAKQMLAEWLKGVTEKSTTDTETVIDASKPANDITHLIRRVKRSTEEEEDDSAKKLKATNGSAIVLTNGTEIQGENGNITEAPSA